MLPLALFGLNADAVQAQLDKIVTSPKIPGIAAAVVSISSDPKIWVSGVRKEGESDTVRISDKWHLGSCTKAMTAAAIASLVEEKKLSWDRSLSKLFPSYQVDTVYKDVTLRHLLAMKGGFDANVNWWTYQNKPDATLTQKRLEFAKETFASTAKDAKVGTFTYSNTSITLAGVAASMASGLEIEELLAEKLFKPLGIRSFGFGPSGKGQPWPHGESGPLPEDNPVSDNAEVLTAAGRIHMSMEDWAKFAKAVLVKHQGGSSVISGTYIDEIKNPILGTDYSMGWNLFDRPWGKGRVLTHSGSNTMNFCTIWVAPNTGKAYLVATNYGGKEAPEICDQVISNLIQQFP